MVSTSVLKSPSDKREYEAVRLRNGLSALLIYDPEIKKHNEAVNEAVDDDDASDTSGSYTDEEDGDDEEDDDEDQDDELDEEQDENEETNTHGKKSSKMAHTKKAAAAICVSVGSFSDPKDAEGLAHFLEHMLFMGSSKFPDENEYDTFLAEHGGSSNANTDMEYTCFHFDVNHLYLKPSLERFAQFFVSPLLKENSLEREIQAVDSEFVQALQYDGCRVDQLRCHTADPRHPYNRFAWGNAKSLSEAITKCENIREKLMGFYKQHYTANRMKLVVLGGEPLDTLKEWVQELFEDIPEGSTDAPEHSWIGGVWPAGKLYRVESVKDQHRLDLSWVLPCLDSHYLKKPQDYISHLIGHEGRGSLLKYLKRKGWAMDLSAGVGEDGFERSTAGYIFSVNIVFTVSGLDKIFEIIQSFFEYVMMLRDNKPQEWVFEEMQAVNSMDFRFVEEEAAYDYVEKLAKNMHVYPEQHIIYGDYAYEQWDAKLLEEILSLLRPNTMRVDLVTKLFDRNTPGVLFEPWFGVPYTVEDLPANLLESWANLTSINPELHVPEVNEFISRDFSLKQAINATSWPSIAAEDDLCKIWYKLDQTFKTPRANIYIAITCRMDTLRSEVLAHLYVSLLKDALNDTLYMATVASLSSSMASSSHKIEIKLRGYNEKLYVLARKISELLTTLVAENDRFQAIKEQLERTYRNAKVKPLSHSGILRLQILKQRYFTEEERLACLSTLCVQDVNDFVPTFFQEAHIEALCHGNLTKEEAVNIVNIVKHVVVNKPLVDKPKERIIKLPQKTDYAYNTLVVNELEENSVTEVYFQIGLDLGAESTREKVLADLFEQIAYEPCFNQLRTIEQLGYRVDCGARYTYGVMGFCFRVMSSKYSPVYIHKRIDLFIDQLHGILKDMTEEAFTKYNECLIAQKMEKDNCLVDETDHHWEHVLNQRYLFDAHEKEALELKSITKEELITWYKKYIRAGGEMRRSLSVHVWGCKFMEELKKFNGVKKNNKKKFPYKVLEDIEDFKSKAELYPPYP